MSATGPIGPGYAIFRFLFKGHTGNIGSDAFDGLRWNPDLRGHHLWAVIRLRVSLGENLETGFALWPLGSVTDPVRLG